MNPEQALEILDKAGSQLNLSRQDHIAIVTAVSVLKEFIKKNSPTQPAKPVVQLEDSCPNG